MTVYVVFRKDYEHRKGELMGILVERRKNMRGETPMKSGLRWARLAFGHLVKDKKDIFVFPKEMKISEEKRLLVDKGVLTKEEFFAIVGVIDREMKTGRR